MNKNQKRMKNKIKKMNNHVNWLYQLAEAGVKIDMDRLMSKKIYNKYYNREDIVAKSHKDVKYVIDRLVSREAKNKK